MITKLLMFVVSILGWTMLFYTLGETVGDGGYLGFSVAAIAMSLFAYYFSLKEGT